MGQNDVDASRSGQKVVGNEVYTPEYFASHAQRSMASARIILGRLFELFQPSSVLDVGCGSGAWLRVGADLGVQKVLGLDGEHVIPEKLLIDSSQFEMTDLRRPFMREGRFDLAISVEVAEHLPYERAPTFVRDLAQSSDVIVFSAAAPFQGGERHMNEQWPEYWAILFRRQGYACFDLFREQCWASDDVESWYAQNVLLFVKAGHAIESKLEDFRADKVPLSRVHPAIFLINVARHRPFASSQLKAEMDDWHQLVKAYVSGELEAPPLTAIAQTQDPDQASGPGFPITRMTYEDDHEVRLLKAAIAEQGKQIALLNAAYAEQIALRDRRANELAEFRSSSLQTRDGLQQAHDELQQAQGELTVLRRQLAVSDQQLRQERFLGSPRGLARRIVFRIVLTGIKILAPVLGWFSPRARAACRQLEELIVARRYREFVRTLGTLVRGDAPKA